MRTPNNIVCAFCPSTFRAMQLYRKDTLLSIGRAEKPGSRTAARYLQEAVEGLRPRPEDLPRGLLVRAAHFRHKLAFNLAKRDLNQVWILASRCGMQLYLADYHLEQSRLLLEQSKVEAARKHRKQADALIRATGYHLRDQELADLGDRLGLA